MTRINTNVASLRSLHNVQKSQDQLNTSLQRLSTGLKINSGKDDPAGLIASEGLRLQITTINQSIDNSNTANNVLSTADSSLGEIGGLLNQIRGLVQQGLNSGALSADQINANQQQIDQALSAINRISANTSFGGQKLIDGSKAFSTATTATDAAKLSDIQVNEALFGQNSNLSVNATVTAAAQQGELRYNGGSLASATTLEVAGSKGNQVLFLGASSTVGNIKDAVNSVSDVTGVSATLRSGLAVGTSAAATTATKAFTAGSDTLTVTANTAGAAGNSITVAFVAGSGNNVATSAAQVGNAITVTLGTDGTGALDATKNTADKVAQVINGISGVTATATNTGNTTGFTAAAAANLAGGADAVGALKFTDARAEGTAGTISVVFADPGSNNAALGISTSAADAQGNRTITVNLATNGSGAITSTAADIVTAIQGDATAKTLVNVKATATGLVTAAASANLTQGNDAELVLKSTKFGSDQYVQVNVLNGNFATTLNDETTASYRNTGTDIQANINGQTAIGQGLNASVKTTQLDVSLSFTSTANVVNNTANVTITGGGSLFQIGQQADASGQIGLGIDGVNTARLGGVAGKLYELGSGGGKSLLDVGPNVPASDLIDIIDQALNKVNTLRGRIGAIQKNVIDTNVATLGVALENITDARSQITDTDFAAETASLQKAQVLSQAGISVLTIANQVPQQVLALLR